MSFGFGINQPASTSGSTNLQFGSPIAVSSNANQTVGTATSFSFGLPVAQSLMSSNSSTSPSAVRPPFSMVTQATTASTMSFTSPFATASSNPGGFSFGVTAFPSVTTTVAPSISTSTVPLTSGFSFGIPTTTTILPASTATTSASGMFNFGILPAATTTTSSLGAFTFGTTTSKPVSSVTTNPLLSTNSTLVGAVPTTSNFTISLTNASTSGPTLGGFCSALSQTSISNPAFTFGKPLSMPSATGSQPLGLPSTSSLSVADSKNISVSASQSTTMGSQLANNFLGKPLSSATSATTFPTLTSKSMATSFPSTSFGIVSSVGSAVTATATSNTATANLPLSKSSPLTYHQLEDTVNKWAHDLEEQERYFMEEADRITEWDSTLLKNAEKISTLYEKVNECKTEQSRLEQELDFIEGQQHELEQLLEPLERAASELPPGHLHSDFEREAIFQLATNVDLEIGQMLSDMREMAAQINSTNSTVFITSPEDDEKSRKITATGDQLSALQQVTRILNCHMHSLNWIHQNTQELMERVKILDSP